MYKYLNEFLGVFEAYRVSQQVWDMLNVKFWNSEKFASEASSVYKMTQ